MVQPASRDFSEAVEMSDTGLCENRRQQISDDAPDSMACKDLHTTRIGSEYQQKFDGFFFCEEWTHIEGIIIAGKELKLSREIAKCASHESEQNGSGYPKHKK